MLGPTYYYGYVCQINEQPAKRQHVVYLIALVKAIHTVDKKQSSQANVNSRGAEPVRDFESAE